MISEGREDVWSVRLFCQVLPWCLSAGQQRWNDGGEGVGSDGQGRDGRVEA